MNTWKLLVMMVVVLFVSACGATGTTTERETDADTIAESDSNTVSAEVSAGSITVSGMWARPSNAMMGEMDHGDEGEMAEGEMDHGSNNGAAYMVISNSGEEVDRLVSASSDVAETVELHTVEAGDGGVMAMRQVEAIEVPAGGETTLEPGGFHVMLVGLTRDLTPGDTFNVTLEFETAGSMDVEFAVREM
ncbi:MAG: hypothetical protein GFH27_549333n114 [Chloroflexi bacterium AL-W]|nr:hypothetical protein [Chloroflexi bacterium AL-N1]NOK70433.1 hypothetical protein [Chloroflexi bacterium AL-N10]NOK78208.1 hypothetical protein [Chloroflexi bacterium AL-N5]NOK85307.1 hypothetical protein [Chloroflexi bacterium AL-W]NOK92072.1 hypothetical protein [Chloroflexi bacterium AL-N15]